ncbi:MAG: PKD domain-containing protein [Thermoplasmata archaeon]|nr:PKD domain-containing protein [Thermoplasmata archaeon]
MTSHVMRLFLFACLTVGLLGVYPGHLLEFHAAPTVRDTEPNDTLQTAEEIIAGGEFIDGSLSSEDVVDVYKVFLSADEVSRGKSAQKGVIYLDHLSGATVVAEVGEGWGRPFMKITVSSGQGKGEFTAPHTGYFYITVKTTPTGGTSTYRLQVGVVTKDTSDMWDGNNDPGNSSSVSSTQHISFSLNPLKNLVNYYQHTLSPGFKIKVVLDGAQENVHVDILSADLQLLSTGGADTPAEYEERQSRSIPLYIRVFVFIDNDHPASDSLIPVEMDIFIWSYTTIPEVNPTDPWDEPVEMEEDTQLTGVVNLSVHFMEAGGDPLTFTVDENPYLLCTIHPDGLVDIKPSPNWWGQTSLTFHAMDFDGMANDTLQVNVLPVNDPPRIVNLSGLDAHPQRGYVVFWVTVGETLVIVPEVIDVDDVPNNLSFSLNTTFPRMEFNQMNGTIVYTPSWDDLGMHWLKMRVRDKSGAEDNTSIRIEVLGYNRPPNTPELYLLESEKQRMVGVPLHFTATLKGDPDGDPITEILWYMGDGATYKGEDRVTHIYNNPGNYTVKLSVCDPYGLCANATLQIRILPKPTKGELLSGYNVFWKDPAEDVVVFERRLPSEAFFRRMEARAGVDILNVSGVGREDGLVVTVRVQGGVAIDGSVKYTIYLVKKDFKEVPANTNITSMDEYYLPTYTFSDEVYLYRVYSGVLNADKNFSISQGDKLVLFLSLSTLISSSVPVESGNFSIFVVAEETSQIVAKTGSRRLFKCFDTAGEGAMVYNVTPIERERKPTTGSEGKLKSNAVTFIVLGIVGLVVFIGGMLLFKKNKEKEEEEMKRFEEEVKKMKEEGKSLFDLVGEGGEGSNGKPPGQV